MLGGILLVVQPPIIFGGQSAYTNQVGHDEYLLSYPGHSDADHGRGTCGKQSICRTQLHNCKVYILSVIFYFFNLSVYIFD